MIGCIGFDNVGFTLIQRDRDRYIRLLTSHGIDGRSYRYDRSIIRRGYDEFAVIMLYIGRIVPNTPSKGYIAGVQCIVWKQLSTVSGIGHVIVQKEIDRFGRLNQNTFIGLAKIVNLQKIIGQIDDSWRTGNKIEILNKAVRRLNDPTTTILAYDGERQFCC